MNIPLYRYLCDYVLDRYFNGDMKIASVDGHGSDVYIYLQSLSHLAQENLPVYNTVSIAKLQSLATQVWFTKAM